MDFAYDIILSFGGKKKYVGQVIDLLKIIRLKVSMISYKEIDHERESAKSGF